MIINKYKIIFLYIFLTTSLFSNNICKEDIYEKVNIKSCGAYGDGKHDDTRSIQKFFTFLNKTGYSGYIPNGNYLINSPIKLLCESDISLELAYNAKLISGKYAKPMITLDGRGYTIQLIGGKFDMSKALFIKAKQSGTALSLKRFNKITLENITFFASKHYENSLKEMISDSGITIVNSKNVLIKDNLFTGFPDAAIYISGGKVKGAIDDGGAYIISNNIFENNNIGVTIKREVNQIVISNNIFNGNKIGISTFDTNTKGTYLRPGENVLINSNMFKNTTSTAIELRVSSHNLITNNIIIDWGYDRFGNISKRIRPAIWLRGTSNTIVSNNLISMKNRVRTTKHHNIKVTDYKTKKDTFIQKNNYVDNKLRSN